jgi:hypothetical protein
MLDGKALAIVVVTYAMYLEVTEGILGPDWKIKDPVGFWLFWKTLLEQLL